MEEFVKLANWDACTPSASAEVPLPHALAMALGNAQSAIDAHRCGAGTARVPMRPHDRNESDDDGARAHSAAAKAGFAAGMQVSFEARGGRRHRGVIAKMNPKRARVECAAGVFLVPYGLLAREDGPCP